ncbi:hypothetical protein ACFLS9_09765 [Bacteroidota bacterium]
MFARHPSADGFRRVNGNFCLNQSPSIDGLGGVLRYIGCVNIVNQHSCPTIGQGGFSMTSDEL